jgi:hemerythrin superfamily protein
MESMETGLRFRLKRAARQIGKQHRHLDRICLKLGEAIADGAIDHARDAFERYCSAVEAHFTLEDEVFFPAIHGLHPEQSGELESLSRDHVEFSEQLRRMAEQMAQAGLEAFAKSFQVYAQTLASHEGREEQLLSKLAGRKAAD